MPNVFKSITRLVYHSNGGFGFQELYSQVPVYVRRFIVGEIEDIKQREKEAMEGNDSGGGEGIPDDMGEAMEKMQKRQGHDGSKEKVQEDLKKVFGDEVAENKDEPKSADDRAQTPPSQRTPLHKQNQPSREQPDREEKEEEPDEQQPDPADADDLEQMINKLKNDM